MTSMTMKRDMSCMTNTNLKEIMRVDLFIKMIGKIEAMEGILGELTTLET